MRIDYEHFGFYNHLETGNFLLKLAILNYPDEDVLLCIDINETQMPGEISGGLYSETEIVPASTMALVKYADANALNETTFAMFVNRIPKFIAGYMSQLVENRMKK